jgi:Protein of unknown function (DUF2442)
MRYLRRRNRQAIWESARQVFTQAKEGCGTRLSVRLKDGRTISVPLAWYPRLFHATAEQRRNWEIAGGGYGIHWPEIDEDISTEGLLRGVPRSAGQQEQLKIPDPTLSATSPDKGGAPRLRIITATRLGRGTLI